MNDLGTSKLEASRMGAFVDELMTAAKNRRRSFERRWYDNNFFDDGYHFRFLNRSQNKIVDLSESQSVNSQLRAIPKASRQIRGVANLLMSPKYVPVVYPQRIIKANFPPIQTIDPNTGQPVEIPNPEYKQAVEAAKIEAQRTGHWIMEEFKAQELNDQITHMVILTAKHGVSFMQVWADALEEKIKTQVYDAFDIYIMGNGDDIQAEGMIAKGVPMLVSEIKANPLFSEEAKAQITPDNRFASSEIKEAYMNARFGKEGNPDAVATIIVKEVFIKERLNEDNLQRIMQQENAQEIISGRKIGQIVMRHAFVAGNILLLDEYIKITKYPFVDFRMEPGNIYQVPLIERFIPQNKSLDLAVSRIERFFHTMNVGAWLKRQGEQVNFSNQSGGQVIEYTSTPPTQVNVASPSAMTFPFIGFLSQLIEEQGVSTASLSKLPSGIRANAAIETLKEAEYASLMIAQDRLKKTVREIAMRFLDIADDYFVTPQTVYLLEKGEPSYFDIVGKSALNRRRELGVADDLPEDVIAISSDYRVEIETDQGMAFTREGQKARVKDLVDTMLLYAKEGLISPEAVKVVLKKWLEVWEFGSTQEFMDAINENPMVDDKTLDRMKIAILEALKDAGEVGQEASDRRIQENKLGTAEALMETGMIEPKPKESKIKTNYEDLPVTGKIQAAAQMGIKITAEDVVRQDILEVTKEKAKKPAVKNDKKTSKS